MPKKPQRSEPNKPSKRPPLPVNEPITDPHGLPDLPEEGDVNSYLNSQHFAHLKNTHLQILMHIGHDLVSDNMRSDMQMAADIGIDRSTIVRARNNVDFGEALAMLTIGIARARSDQYLRWTEQAAKKGSAAALKLLWQLTGLLIERRANQHTISIQSSRRTTESFEDMVDEFLIAMGGASYTSEWITSRFLYLKSTGAF